MDYFKKQPNFIFQKGSAAILLVILILSVSLFSVLMVSNIMIGNIQTTRQTQDSVRSYQVAESGMEYALKEIYANLNIPNSAAQCFCFNDPSCNCDSVNWSNCPLVQNLTTSIGRYCLSINSTGPQSPVNGDDIVIDIQARVGNIRRTAVKQILGFDQANP